MTTSSFATVPSRRSALTLAAAAAMGAALSGVATAQSVWDGGAGDSVLENPVNWSSDALPSINGGTALFNGTVSGPLALNYTTGLGGTFGNLGINFDIAAAQTDTLSIDSGTSTTAIRINNITLAAGSGAFTLGNGANTFNITLGGAGGQIHTWTNNSSNTATVLSDTRFGMGGGGSHALLVSGSGNWSFSNLLTPTNAANLSLHKTGSGEASFSGGGTLTAGVTAYGGSFAAVLKEGTTRFTAGSYSANNGEWVVGGLDTVGTNTSFIMDAGSLASVSWLSVGRGNGTGTTSSDLTLNNGATISATNISAGFNAGNGTTAPKANITLNNTSALTLAATGAFQIAESAGSNVTMVLNGSSTVTMSGAGSATNRYIGNTGATGSLTLNNSAGFTAGNGILNVGYQTGTGTLNLNGGTFSNAGEIRVGASNTNGAFSGGSGTINVAGGTLTAGALTLARGNNNQALMNGTVNVTGGTFNAAGDVVLGYAGSGNLGKLVVDGGTFNMATTAKRWLIVQFYDTANGQIDVNSGVLNLNFDSDIRFSRGNAFAAGTNTINLNGGAITAHTGLATGAGSTAVVDLGYDGAAAANNTFNLNGGTLTIGQVVTTSNTPQATFNFNGGTLRATIGTGDFLTLGGTNQRANVRDGGAVIDTNGNNVTIAQALEHSNIGGDNAIDGGLTKNGSGTLTLSGANTYTGETVVAAGVLAVNGSINGGDVTVQAGAALQGTGTITTTGLSIAANATLAPGNSIGTLTVTGGLTIAGTYDWEFNGGASSADLVDVNGLLTLSGATLSAIDFNPVSYTLGQKFTLAAYDTLSGSFTGLSDDLVYTLGGNLWQINYDDTTAGLNGGSGSAYITLTAVPEPSTALLGLAGALALFRRRRS